MPHQQQSCESYSNPQISHRYCHSHQGRVSLPHVPRRCYKNPLCLQVTLTMLPLVKFLLGSIPFSQKASFSSESEVSVRASHRNVSHFGMESRSKYPAQNWLLSDKGVHCNCIKIKSTSDSRLLSTDSTL